MNYLILEQQIYKEKPVKKSVNYITPFKKTYSEAFSSNRVKNSSS